MTSLKNFMKLENKLEGDYRWWNEMIVILIDDSNSKQ